MDIISQWLWSVGHGWFPGANRVLLQTTFTFEGYQGPPLGEGRFVPPTPIFQTWEREAPVERQPCTSTRRIRVPPTPSPPARPSLPTAQLDECPSNHRQVFQSLSLSFSRVFFSFSSSLMLAFVDRVSLPSRLDNYISKIHFSTCCC